MSWRIEEQKEILNDPKVRALFLELMNRQITYKLSRSSELFTDRTMALSEYWSCLNALCNELKRKNVEDAQIGRFIVNGLFIFREHLDYRNTSIIELNLNI